MTTDANPKVSAPMRRCVLVARNPGQKVRWVAPSQQRHSEIIDATDNTNVVAATDGIPAPCVHNS